MPPPKLGQLLTLLRSHGVTAYDDGKLKLSLGPLAPVPPAPQEVEPEPEPPSADMLFALEDLMRRGHEGTQ